MAEGEFHESANLAALWKLPVLFCCENNRYAMGTALAREHAQTDLATRAASYGMIAWAVDGMDAEAVAEATRRAVDQVRGGGGPCFLELRTYRFRAHSMYDPDRYREKSEIEQWKRSDPIPALTEKLKSRGALTDAEVSRWSAEIEAEIEAAVDAAEAAEVEPVADLTRYVTSPADGSGGPR
jgi:pyruvate dehydrogenase E1 component alpha subunit